MSASDVELVEASRKLGSLNRWDKPDKPHRSLGRECVVACLRSERCQAPLGTVHMKHRFERSRAELRNEGKEPPQSWTHFRSGGTEGTDPGTGRAWAAPRSNCAPRT